MQFKKLVSYSNGKKFIIDEDLPEVGAYLYIYDGERCIYDCLQDSIAICKELALEKYNIPLESREYERK